MDVVVEGYDGSDVDFGNWFVLSRDSMEKRENVWTWSRREDDKVFG